MNIHYQYQDNFKINDFHPWISKQKVKRLASVGSIDSIELYFTIELLARSEQEEEQNH